MFTDRPTSAKGPDRRPGEMALIDAIRNGAIDRVLIWSIDRIGRSLVERWLDSWRCAERPSVALWVARAGDRYRAIGRAVSRLRRDDGAASAPEPSGSDFARSGGGPESVDQIRTPAYSGKAKIEKAKTFLAMGKGVREVARLAGGISPSSVSRIAASLRSTAAV